LSFDRRVPGLLREALARQRERNEVGQPLGVRQVRRRIRVCRRENSANAPTTDCRS
jgi:hypothetical protein